MARTDSRPRLRLDPDARREAILRSASAAFAERPYAEVTLADIAEGARASTPLVYRYFHGKEDLYAQVVRESVDALMERQARAIDAVDILGHHGTGLAGQGAVKGSFHDGLDHGAL